MRMAFVVTGATPVGKQRKWPRPGRETGPHTSGEASKPSLMKKPSFCNSLLKDASQHLSVLNLGLFTEA